MKCSRCNKRKAKRNCPSLGVKLCNLCCGILREKEIHCVPSCPYLKKHKTYQDKKTLEKSEKPPSRDAFTEEDILNDERMIWLALHIEAPLKEHGEKNPSFTDKDALLALEYAKDKVSKGKGTVIIPGKDYGPKDEIGEAVLESMENCRYEKSIIVPGEMQTYTPDEKTRCLERIIQSATFSAKGDYEGRSYVDQVISRMEKIQEFSGKKIF